MFGVVDDHLPERARIDEQQVGIAEMEYDVGVHWARRPGVDEQELASHPQVDHQAIARIEWREEVLAAATGSDEGAARETVDQCLARGAPHGSLATDFDALDAASDHETFQASPDRFDLRQFRHR